MKITHISSKITRGIHGHDEYQHYHKIVASSGITNADTVMSVICKMCRQYQLRMLKWSKLQF